MNELIRKSNQKTSELKTEFYRYLFNQINHKNRLISILGARGSGKTTLLLQIAKKYNYKNVLYVALDDLFFTNNTLYSLAQQFDQQGGEILLLDEVHKYPNWSRELKLIYDDFSKLQVYFTSSSILDIYKGESDLSRRAISYNLKELSFREFMEFHHQIELPQIDLNSIITNHEEISLSISKQIRPLQYFPDYLKHGAYPYYDGDENDYFQKLRNIINLTLEIDLAASQNINYETIAKVKRLLFILSTNVPFTPNISKLSERIGIYRNQLVEIFHFIKKAELIIMLFKQSKSISSLSKPDKVWLQNTNLNYAISNMQPDQGNLRETFFVNQLQHIHSIQLAQVGDFIVNDKFIFEIGEKSKTRKQIKNEKNAFLVKDNIETGVLNEIPLWIFGLLY